MEQRKPAPAPLSPEGLATASDEASNGRYLRLLFILLASVTIFEGYDVTIFHLCTPDIVHTFHLSDLDFGAVASLVRLGGMTAFVVVMLADRVGRKPVVSWTVLFYTLFTLLTALEQNVPFGYPQTVPAAADLTGFTNCAGGPTGPWHVINDSPSEKGAYTLYNATAQSVNIYFAEMERKVGLCNVVKTAAALGMTRADGRSLFKWDGPSEPPADDIPAFTLGAVNVSPMSMAAAYATVAARGMYCRPIAVSKIVSSSGARLPIEQAGCHQAIPTGVADAANYILQSVLTVGTAAGLGIGRPAAGKTGTSDNFDYAAFGGYTPDLAGYVSVFNPVDPVRCPTSGTGPGPPG